MGNTILLFLVCFHILSPSIQEKMIQIHWPWHCGSQGTGCSQAKVAAKRLAFGNAVKNAVMVLLMAESLRRLGCILNVEEPNKNPS